MAYEADEPLHGYHTRKIEKGEFGQFSKINEEVQELRDALRQDCKIMALMELSDLYGAIRGFLKMNYPEMTMADLEKMSDITERTFINGFRN